MTDENELGNRNWPGQAQLFDELGEVRCIVDDLFTGVVAQPKHGESVGFEPVDQIGVIARAPGILGVGEPVDQYCKPAGSFGEGMPQEFLRDRNGCAVRCAKPHLNA